MATRSSPLPPRDRPPFDQADSATGAGSAALRHSSPKKRRWQNPKQFFVVFSPEGLAPPRIIHSTHKGAMFAAVQMAKDHPEASFFVMGSMSAPVKPREERAVEA